MPPASSSASRFSPFARGRDTRLTPTSPPTSQGLDPFKIAGASISGWYPSTKTASGRHPFTSQLEFALGLYLEFHPLVASYQRGDLSPAFARAHHLDAPLGTPYAIAYAFGEKPHVYLPDYVGTLVGGVLLVAEAGRAEEKSREQARAKLDAARALVALKGGALWIGTDENLSRRRQQNLVFLHARGLSFPAFTEVAREIDALWQSEELPVAEVIARLDGRWSAAEVEAAAWKLVANATAKGRLAMREYVLHLRSVDNPYRRRQRAGAPAPGMLNSRTGKPYLATGYKPSTINHRLSVLKSYYEYDRMQETGPKLNPVPAPAAGERPNAHHTPDDPWVPMRRAPYRQKQPQGLPRALTDDLWEEVFRCLTSNRDRAIFCLLLSSGSRAGELLKMTSNDVDWGRQCVRLITKGSNAAQWVAASPDFFRWLALYLTDRGDLPPEEPLWWTLREPRGPLTYQALRKILVRINEQLGTNLVLHDFRHTCALRLASDPSVPIVHVQAHLRHKHLSTTERYLRARPEDVIASVQSQRRALHTQPNVSTATPANGNWRYAA